MKKIIIVLVSLCSLIAIVWGIFFLNHSKTTDLTNTDPTINYPQNECSKKICKSMVSEGISGFARLTEENKIEIYVDGSIEVDTTTINQLIPQVEDPYLCSIRIDKDNGMGIPHVNSIVIANYTPKDIPPRIAPPYQLSESDITEKNSHSEHFYFLFVNYFPNNVINSSMPEITHLTIAMYNIFYETYPIDINNDFAFLEYLPNLEYLKIIQTENGDRSFENSYENIEQLKNITPEGCVIEIEN